MQIDLRIEIEIFSEVTNDLGEGTYRLKVHFTPLEFYMDFKFTLFHAHNGEYELYPGSYLEKSSGRWKDKFEYDKHSSFYLCFLDEVVDKVEAYASIIITRTHYEKHQTRRVSSGQF